MLLYSPSGAGKTSLVQARLVPRLEEDGFAVCPVVRVNHDVSAGAPWSDGPAPNRYVLSTLLSPGGGNCPPRRSSPIAELAGMTLTEYLAEAAATDGRPDNAVLVFDQFEEMLTIDPTDSTAKDEFFDQVGRGAARPGRWALFAMREDFVAELDPYPRLIPSRFATRYRLDLLEVPAALEAITLLGPRLGRHLPTRTPLRSSSTTCAASGCSTCGTVARSSARTSSQSSSRSSAGSSGSGSVPECARSRRPTSRASAT